MKLPSSPPQALLAAVACCVALCGLMVWFSPGGQPAAESASLAAGSAAACVPCGASLVDSAPAGQHRNVFVDVGANRGDTTKTFFRYPGFPSKDYRKVNNPINFTFPRNPETWELHLFEALERVHGPSLREIQGAHPNVQLHFNALAGRDGPATVRIYRDTRADAAETGAWGSSSVLWGAGADPNAYDDVPAVYLGDFLARRFSVDDFVVVKMNCESCEFDTLRSMMDDGTYCLIDKLYVWWHPAFVAGKSAELDAWTPVFEKSFAEVCGGHVAYSSSKRAPRA